MASPKKVSRRSTFDEPDNMSGGRTELSASTANFNRPTMAPLALKSHPFSASMNAARAMRSSQSSLVASSTTSTRRPRMSREERRSLMRTEPPAAAMDIDVAKQPAEAVDQAVFMDEVIETPVDKEDSDVIDIDVDAEKRDESLDQAKRRSQCILELASLDESAVSTNADGIVAKRAAAIHPEFADEDATLAYATRFVLLAGAFVKPMLPHHWSGRPSMDDWRMPSGDAPMPPPYNERSAPAVHAHVKPEHWHHDANTDTMSMEGTFTVMSVYGEGAPQMLCLTPTVIVAGFDDKRKKVIDAGSKSIVSAAAERTKGGSARLGRAASMAFEHLRAPSVPLETSIGSLYLMHADAYTGAVPATDPRVVDERTAVLYFKLKKIARVLVVKFVAGDSKLTDMLWLMDLDTGVMYSDTAGALAPFVRHVPIEAHTPNIDLLFDVAPICWPVVLTRNTRDIGVIGVNELVHARIHRTSTPSAVTRVDTAELLAVLVVKETPMKPARKPLSNATRTAMMLKMGFVPDSIAKINDMINAENAIIAEINADDGQWVGPI